MKTSHSFFKITKKMAEINNGNIQNFPVSHIYCMLHNIPSIFHTSDLRNFFSEFIAGEKFSLFHFRHRPQIVKTEETNQSSENKKSDNNSKRFCCIIRFDDDNSVNLFIKRYHGKLWIDKDGNDLPAKCTITKVSLSDEDLKRFSSKELHPPNFMPRGNVGTPDAHFLGLIRQCRLPPSLIKKLGLEFPRARIFKRYSKVPFDYGTGAPIDLESDEEEEVKTAKGHTLNEVYVSEKASTSADTNNLVESDNESNADDDNDRCEEWERHEALHDHRTTHGDVTSESKERLYETDIELQWEKGGPGIVWYTDAQFWDQQRGGFDEKTADDWDVDMEGYYEPGGGDKDANDLMNMRRSERVRTGLETISVIKTPQEIPSTSKRIPVRLQQDGRIGKFEKHTRGVGRKLMEKLGWKDGDGLGKTIKGIPDALEGEGQVPRDKRGFGYYGEKLDLENPKKRSKEFKEYDIEAEDRIVIGTIYDKPEDLDIPEPLKRRNAPTFVKRYDTMKSHLPTPSTSSSTK